MSEDFIKRMFGTTPTLKSWQISTPRRKSRPEEEDIFLNKLRSKQSEVGWKLRNNYGGDSNDRMRETGCVKTRWGEGVEGCHKSDCRTCCRSPQREDDCCVSNTFVTSGCILCLRVFTGKIKSQMWGILFKNTGKRSSLPSKVTPQAALRLSLFCGNSLARPLIVIHPSCAPVYKREIRISITRAQRQRDWWVSHRIPSVSYPSLCFRSEKRTLSSAMIRFSLHISI